MLNKKLKDTSGYTVLELLVVAGIVILISAVIIFSVSRAKAKARDSQRMHDIQEIHAAIQYYIQDNGIPPEVGLATETSGWTTLQTQLSTYITTLPMDPCGTRCNGKGKVFGYVYRSPSLLTGVSGTDEASYIIYADSLETKSGDYGFGLEFLQDQPLAD